MTSAAPRRVLVLGGTGFIGSAVSTGLRDAGAEVAVVARHAPVGRQAEAIAGCELLLADVEDPRALGELLDGVDLVVHAVGRSLPAESNADPVTDATTSLVSILRALEALRTRPTARLFYLSSGGAIYGNVSHLPIGESDECLPISSYGVMKLAAEKYLAMYETLYGISSVSLRVANAYGPGQPVRASQGFVAACFDAVHRGAPVRLYGSGLNVRDYVYLGDVVHAVVSLAELAVVPPRVNVGSGTGHSLLDVLSLVREVTGVEVRLERVPGRPVDVDAIVLDTSRLCSLVPWAPIGLEEGLRQTWEHVARAPMLRGPGH